MAPYAFFDLLVLDPIRSWCVFVAFHASGQVGKNVYADLAPLHPDWGGGTNAWYFQNNLLFFQKHFQKNICYF